MKLKEMTTTGPYTHENLDIYFLHGKDSYDGNRYMPLDEAMERGCVIVHETGNVGRLEVENLSEEFDLYVQAGDVVKGGRQDRTLAVDFVLPAKSGRIPIPSFCVEQGRWNQRGAENVHSFSSAKSNLSYKELRLAAKLSRSQEEVWCKVAEAQQLLSASLGKPLHVAASPTSYQLSVEDESLLKRSTAFKEGLAKVVPSSPAALGFVFAVNGTINTCDVYGSSVLFRKLWPKLLDSAVLEAIGLSHQYVGSRAHSPTIDTVLGWLKDADLGVLSDRREAKPRTRVDTRISKGSVVFESFDHAGSGEILHTNIMAR